MNQERLMHILQAPHMTEKSAAPNGDYPQFAFKVLRTATKPEVRAAVEQLFSVKVHSVRIVNQKGKQTRTGRIEGKHQDWKKAYVLLEKDQEIDLTGQS
ncbi:MAG: 50S ribosomal protein L23 [Gammaproteobacteria bacterium]|nr:50S ribosomal protein L23 [Gammaproteobacteria bacterium]MCH9744874.1 50S ribosomal protein L23 [Gammaproteobacteria bacterium]